MSGFLLDTNVVSETLKANRDPSVSEWFHRNDESLMFLSVLTLGEIRKGAAKLAAGPKRTSVEQWLSKDLPLRFRGRILPISAEVADRWGILQASAREVGRPLPVIDSLLMATALHHNLVFVTRNVKDLFQAIPHFNPWQHNQ